MLQKMRDQTQSLAFKVLVGIIILVLAVFGFGAFNLFVTGDPEVASVNGEGITQAELAAETERERRRIAAQMGEDFDPATIDPVRMQGAVLDRMIARMLLDQSADELGMGISRARVDQLLVSNPSFQAGGEFAPELYRQAVRAMGYAPQEFLDETARRMVLEQLQRGIAETAFLTDRGRNVHVALLAQQRDVAYLPFGIDRFREQVSVSDDEVARRYEENQLDYMTKERVDVAYVTLDREALQDDPAVEVAEADVRSAYEAEREAAPAEEERQARHILLETGDARDAEEAARALEDIKARVEAGEPFADIARAVSEDPGSAAQGGELGYVSRGIFDPAFEEALFALEEPGDISAPVETDFGYHLIQLMDIRKNEYPSFEEARADLEARLRLEQADEVYAQRLRELDNLAFENPNSLEPIESSLGLERRTAEGVTRTEGPAPFDDEEVRERLFGSEVLEQGYNSSAVEFEPGSAVVMRVTERHESEPIPLEEVAGEIRAEIEAERARSLAREAHAAARSRLEAGESASEVASAHDASWQRFELVRRNAQEVPRPVLQAAFSLPRPGQNAKSIGEATLPDGGLALITVTRVRDGDPAALSESELTGMGQFLADRVQRLEFGAYYQTLQDQASIERVE